MGDAIPEMLIDGLYSISCLDSVKIDELKCLGDVIGLFNRL